MARVWQRVDLAGVRNGVNLIFSVSLPSGADVRVIHNTRVLYQAAATPLVNQYVLDLHGAITLKHAPRAEDDLWAIVVYDNSAAAILFAFDNLPENAPALLQYHRKTFPFSVRIFNKAGEQIEYIDSDVISASWKYNALGGCAEATISLRRPFDTYGDIDLEYGIEIWRELDMIGEGGAVLPAILPATLGTSYTGVQERRWSGLVREIEPILEDDESVELRCNGWSRQLEYIIVPAPATPWTNMDIGAIVRDIVNTYVLPGSQIKLSGTYDLVPDTGIVLSSFTLETSAFQAIGQLAELAGNAEWGVRSDKEFFFRQRTDLVRQTWVIGDTVAVFRKVESVDDIVTRVYLRGDGGQRYVLTYAGQEAGYYKDRTLQVTSITDADTAQLWGDAYFARFGLSQPSGRCVIGQSDEWIERSGAPLGLFRVIGGPVFTQAGDALPATLPMTLGQIYGTYTDTSFRINSITYTPTDDALQIDLDLGERSNHLADYLRRIEYRLSEMQQALNV